MRSRINARRNSSPEDHSRVTSTRSPSTTRGAMTSKNTGATTATTTTTHERAVVTDLGSAQAMRTRVTDGPNGTKITSLGRLAPSADLQANIRNEDWNDYLIIANGNHLQHYINGRCTADVIDDGAKAAKSGILALQIHVGPPMKVQFKDLKLKRRP